MRRAHTFIELLIVLALVGLLAGLLLSAVQKVREAANRTRCASHLRQLGIAVHAHHDARGALPPSRLDCHAGTWHNALLPHLEQDAAAALWLHGRAYHFQPDEARALRVPVYRCPSRPDRGPSRSGDGRGRVPHRPGSTGDYAVVIGDGRPWTLDHHPALAASLGHHPGVGPWVHAAARCWGVDPDFRHSVDAAEVLFVTFAGLTRGLSQTLIVGEKALTAGDTSIWNPDDPLANGRVVGPRHPLGASFGGPHPGVTLFGWADGSCRPLANTIDPAELGRLATRE